MSAQQDSVAVLGVLVGAAAPNDRAVEAFRAGLRELGHEEGRNLKIEFRTAEGHPDRLPRLAEDLIQLKPDVILVGNETEARVIKRAASTIPIVLVNNTDHWFPEGLDTLDLRNAKKLLDELAGVSSAITLFNDCAIDRSGSASVSAARSRAGFTAYAGRNKRGPYR